MVVGINNIKVGVTYQQTFLTEKRQPRNPSTQNFRPTVLGCQWRTSFVGNTRVDIYPGNWRQGELNEPSPLPDAIRGQSRF